MSTIHNGAASLNPVAKWAECYLLHGIQPIRVPFGTKAPIEKGWQKRLYRAEEITNAFAGNINIGLLLGKSSGDLVCVDADSQHAVILAPLFLPKTEMICGRLGKPNSGLFYRCSVKTTRFTDPRKSDDGKQERVVELLSTGTQKLVHPSIHPTGEQYVWSECDPFDIPKIDATDLLFRVGQLAAAALLAKYWPGVGVLQETALALSGALIRSGVDSATVEDTISRAAWAAGDEEWEQRGACAGATNSRLQSGQNATGFPRAAEFFGDDVLAHDASRIRRIPASTNSNADATTWQPRARGRLRRGAEGLRTAVRAKSQSSRWEITDKLESSDRRETS